MYVFLFLKDFFTYLSLVISKISVGLFITLKCLLNKFFSRMENKYGFQLNGDAPIQF